MRPAAFAVALSALALPSLAQAQDAPDNWAFELRLGTDNRSKDASKSDGDPFALGALTWTDDSGRFYVTGEGETIDSSTGSTFEAELAVGWTDDLAGFGVDLNAAHKWLLDADPGADDDAWEFTADISRRLTDRVDARVRLQYSPDSAGSTRSWTWIEARGRVRLTDRLRASAAIGRREQVNSRDYTGWNIGAEYRIDDHVAVDLRWYDTDVAVPGDQYHDAVVGVVTVGF